MASLDDASKLADPNPKNSQFGRMICHLFPTQDMRENFGYSSTVISYSQFYVQIRPRQQEQV